MDVPVAFPTPREKLLQEASRCRAATPGERLEALLELGELCGSLLAASPRREHQLRLLEESEEAGRRAFREVIARHAGR